MFYAQKVSIPLEGKVPLGDNRGRRHSTLGYHAPGHSRLKYPIDCVQFVRQLHRGHCRGEDGLWEHRIHHEDVLEVPLLFRLGAGPAK